MDKLKVKLENCYGIKKLEYTFDFSKCHTFVVYAQNGVMKTSFAKTFDDYIVGNDSRDQVFNKEPYLREIFDKTNSPIDVNDIFIIKSFIDTEYTSDNLSTLLIRSELRKKYEEILSYLNNSKNDLLKILATNTQSTDCEKEIISTFSYLGDNFYEILEKLFDEISSTKYRDYSFRYNFVFDNDVVKRFVEKNRNNIKLYHDKYFEILSKSDDFFTSDGNFGTAQAADILDSVADDSFFKAGHKMTLKDKTLINSYKELDTLVKMQISKVLSDPELEKQFEKIDKALRPKNIQPMKKIIEGDKSLLLELIDYSEFQKNYWKSHLSKVIDNLTELNGLYDGKKKEIEKIIEEANKKSDEWVSTVKIFKKRFCSLPFRVKVQNTKDSVLGLKKPELAFYFIDVDTGKKKKMERDFLSKNVLSQGEKRAFYLLNVIFEIRARLLQKKRTLFIIDDIADSFDYKNKYAIVEYLNDISNETNFYSMILTHNFDFYKTLGSRLGLCRQNKLHAIKTKQEIKIIEEVYQNQPFKTWRENMKSNRCYSVNDVKKYILALISFTRNLIEYTGTVDSTTRHGDDFETLTSLLHSKTNTKNITFGDLKLLYKKYLNNDDFDSSINDTDAVYDQLLAVASSININEFNLENKIVLAIAIRQKAEEYMWSVITDKTPIDECQTRELFKRYKNEFEGISIHRDKITVLESVNIMTPENIHINSFMYEPILDMGVDELKKLYDDVCNL